MFNVGVTPSSITIHPTKRLAYVTNSNNYLIPGSDSVTVLDLKNKVLRTTIYDPSFNQPYRSAFYQNKLYVTNSGSPSQLGLQGTVSIIDTISNEVVGTMTGFDGPSSIVIHNHKAYVTNYGADGGVGSGNGNTISVVDLKTNSIINTITVDLAPAALTVKGNTLYVVNYTTGEVGSGTLQTINLNNLSITSTISGLSGPFEVIVQGNHAYVSNFGSNNFAPYGTTVSVVNIMTKEIVKNIVTGIQPSGMTLSYCGSYLYVTNYNALYAAPNYQQLTYGEGSLTIIRDQEVIKTMAAGQGPSFVATTPDGSVYVTNYAQNIVRKLI